MMEEVLTTEEAQMVTEAVALIGKMNTSEKSTPQNIFLLRRSYGIFEMPGFVTGRID